MPIFWKKSEDGRYRWFAGTDPIQQKQANKAVWLSSQTTYLIAKINHQWVGQLEAQHGPHAEEHLLQALHAHWQDLLQENIVHRPSRWTPEANVLSIRLTNSPCVGCGPKLIEYRDAMNRASVSKWNPMGINWNLQIRMKIRRVYPADLQDGRYPVHALKEIMDAGIFVRLWDIAGELEKDPRRMLRKDGTPHELSKLDKAFLGNTKDGRTPQEVADMQSMSSVFSLNGDLGRKRKASMRDPEELCGDIYRRYAAGVRHFLELYYKKSPSLNQALVDPKTAAQLQKQVSDGHDFLVEADSASVHSNWKHIQSTAITINDHLIWFGRCELFRAWFEEFDRILAELVKNTRRLGSSTDGDDDVALMSDESAELEPLQQQLKKALKEALVQFLLNRG